MTSFTSAQRGRGPGTGQDAAGPGHEAGSTVSTGRPRPQTLAEKLDRLFATLHARGRARYSYRAVADAIQAHGGPTLSASYLWQLHTGRKDNPTKRQLEGLAAFFGVPPDYFFDDEAAARLDAELALVAALRDAGVRRIALRAAGLSPRSLTVLAGLLDHLRRLEGLPGVVDEPDGPRHTGQAAAGAAR